MQLDLNFVKARLLSRGVQLNEPYQGNPIKAAESAGIIMDSSIGAIYGSFNGFPEGVVDEASCIRIWHLHEVLEHIQENSETPRVSFADFMMDSQSITYDVSDACQPVSYAGSKDRLAISFPDFLLRLVSGSFDFL